MPLRHCRALQREERPAAPLSTCCLLLNPVLLFLNPLPFIPESQNWKQFKLTLRTTKTGRSISHFEIAIKSVKSKFESANSGATASIQQIKTLTPIQANKFAKLLANDNNFGGKFARSGESMNEFINRLSNELQKDAKKIADYLPFLKKCGFKF